MEQPSHGLLQDADAPPTAGRFRPYASTKHRVTRGRYITSNDRRGYIPVYEYPLNGQWIMMDIDDGYILWTGIWKALGNAKADIVKMLESQPDLAPQLRRVRGGYLKIQGTWMPYEVALRLARRVAWTIREDLIPLFGPTFPATCLAPDQPGYGQILGNQPGKRRGRRAAVPLPLPASLPAPQPSDSDTSPGDRGQQTRQPGPSPLPPLSAVTTEEHHPHLLSPSQIAGPSGTRHDGFRDESRYSSEIPSVVRYPEAGMRSQLSGHATAGHNSSAAVSLPTLRSYMHTTSERSHYYMPSSGPVRDSVMDNVTHGGRDRFSPYQSAVHSRHRSAIISDTEAHRPFPVDVPPLTIPSSQPHSGPIAASPVHTVDLAATHGDSDLRTSVPARNLQINSDEVIALPPINVNSPGGVASDTMRRRSWGSSGYSLPPISALSNLPLPPTIGSSSYRFDSAAVLRRLALDDEELGEARRSSIVSVGDAERSHRDPDDHTFESPTQDQLSRRRRSLSEPSLQPDVLPHAAGLVAPRSSLDPSSNVSSRPAQSFSVTTTTDFARPEIKYSDTRHPSTSSVQRGVSYEYRRNEPLSYLHEDLERGNVSASQVEGSTFALSSHTELSNKVNYMDVTEDSRRQPESIEKHHARHPSFNVLSEPPRPHTYSRTSTPLGDATNPQTSSGRSHAAQHPAVEGSFYRLGSESPHGPEEAFLPSYQRSRTFRNEWTPADDFHSPSPSR